MSGPQAQSYYDQLPVLDSFFQVSKQEEFLPLPNDWFVGVTDIVNSSDAIQQNHYKLVNILGASPIVGLLNATTDQKLPFSFGGDGCVICLPPSLFEEARNVFAESRKIGLTEFDLDLRAALIPVKAIRDKGYEVKVARFRVSEQFDQTVFAGGGLHFAESFIKTNPESSYTVFPDEATEEADFSGLECRWKEVKPDKKLVITLLVQSNPNREHPEGVYDQVLRKMQDIFGFDNLTNPIPPSALKMNMSLPKVKGEVLFRTSGKSPLQRIAYYLKILVQIILGKIFMITGYQSSATNWSLYKSDLSLNNDHRKFDDMLRLVISGSQEQLDQLSAHMENMYDKGDLVYGMHTSETALITCMVFAYHRQHFHFIDGSNGGYVQAAKDMKQRVRGLN